MPLALTTAQIEELKTIAVPLTRALRRRSLEMLGAVLRGRTSVGDGELSRLAHAIAHELLAEPQDRQRARPRRERDDAVRGLGAVP